MLTDFNNSPKENSAVK